MSDLKTQASVSYDKNNEEVVVRRKRRKIMGPFSAIGKMSDVHSDTEDIFDSLDQVSKGAFRLFNELKKRRDPDNNLTVFVTTGFTKTHKESFSRHLKELRQQNIVKIAQRTMLGVDPRRPYATRKQTYMLNPSLIKCWHYEDADILWLQCKA